MKENQKKYFANFYTLSSVFLDFSKNSSLTLVGQEHRLFHCCCLGSAGTEFEALLLYSSPGSQNGLPYFASQSSGELLVAWWVVYHDQET